MAQRTGPDSGLSSSHGVADRAEGRTGQVPTGLVATAGLLYLLWAVDASLPGMSGTRATGVAVLALGFAASTTAVVPSFDDLLHGNKTYLVVTALIGLVAAAGGVQLLLTASAAGLTAVMAAMAALWLIATIHHSVLARNATPPRKRSGRLDEARS